MAINQKSGNSFIYFSVIAFLLIVGTLSIVPPAAFPLSLTGHALFLAFLLDIRLWSGHPETWWAFIPSPVIAIAHSLVFGGGIYLNRGKRDLGITLIVLPMVAVVVSTAPLYLLSIIVLPMAQYDMPDGGKWTSPFIVVTPLVYFAAVAIVFVKASKLRQTVSKRGDTTSDA